MGSIPNPLEFKILRASEDDFVTLASVESIANFHMIKTDPKDSIARIIFGPRPPSQENWELRAKGLVEEAKKGSVLRMYKAVVEEADGKQKIIGCAFWFFYTDPEALEIEDYEDIEWPAPTNGAAANEIFGGLAALRKKYMNGKKHAFLQVLATLPEYRGRGVASALLRQGMNDAAKEGLDEFYLSASADGHDLYEKFGFRDLEPFKVDLEKYGGGNRTPIIAMRKTSGDQ